MSSFSSLKSNFIRLNYPSSSKDQHEQQCEQHIGQSLKLKEKLEDVLNFTFLTPLSGICICCYLVCCILVHMIFVLHYSSSWLVWRKVSKLEKFLQEAKTLCFNRLQVYHNRFQQDVWSMKNWVSYWFNRLMISHDRLHCCLRLTNLFRSLCFNWLPNGLIDYFSLA